ncbi:Carboxylesterase-like protein [Operophtera brumata]|uniref:Carboxylesterase-like protein n=1 Tax=Operophtera brumata TaxID=104452 RepID=A0A0L7LQI3_OPEBR|nr:Carboxylesterase-like protein [Operophtera brumata]
MVHWKNVSNITLIFFSHLFYVNTYDVDVHLKQGKLKGTSGVTLFEGKLYFAFYGVPYAQPPIGKLRFKNPKPTKKWNKYLDARTEYHGACAQAHIVHKHGLYGNEDCLHLNIFTPSLYKTGQKLKAVIVWIHGYAFTSSFSHIHGPDFFIDEDVIFVTVSHRLGAFGFLKLNETDQNANMGLKDIVMSLKWIQKNVKHFGGDKTNLSVMGSGSAATFLSLLMTTKSKKLFSKAIFQSGSMFSASLFQGDHNIEKYRLEEKLKIKGYRNINEASTQDIVDASPKIYSNSDVIDSQRPLIPFLPIIETESKFSLLTKRPEEYFSDKQDDLNNRLILIGFNSKEGISEVIPFLHYPHYLSSLAVHFKYMVPFSTRCSYNFKTSKYKEIAGMILNGYFKDGVSVKSVEQFLQYSSDLIKYPIYDFIQRHKQIKGSKMYVYKFTYSGNLNIVKANSISGINTKIKGAASGDEICYMLKCEPLWESYVNLNRDYNSRDRIFIKKITELWANFAKTGDPTPSTYKGNVTWPPMTELDDKVFNLGKVYNIIDSKKEKRMFAFWNDIYRKYYKDCGLEGHDEL